jgi:hypothetical protein
MELGIIPDRYSNDTYEIIRDLEYVLEGTSILDSCLWQYDERDGTWQTGCGSSWIIGPEPRDDTEMLFCPSCGKRIDEGEEIELAEASE